MYRIRGTSYESPHGIPIDLLDRMLIISTDPYTQEELLNILKIRAEEEDVAIDDGGFQFLAGVAEETSLRYAMQLITTAHLVAKRAKRDEVKQDDLAKCYDSFLDEARSAEELDRQNSEYMFHRVKNSTVHERENPNGIINGGAGDASHNVQNRSLSGHRLDAMQTDQ